MKLALATLLMFSALPVSAESIGDRSNRRAYQSQSGYARQEKCFKRVYREEYVPGTLRNPGYVRTYKKRVAVPCEPRAKIYHRHHHHHGRTYHPPQREDSCAIMMITLASKVQFLVASVVLVSVLLLPEVMVVSGQSL